MTMKPGPLHLLVGTINSACCGVVSASGWPVSLLGGITFEIYYDCECGYHLLREQRKPHFIVGMSLTTDSYTTMHSCILCILLHVCVIHPVLGYHIPAPIYRTILSEAKSDYRYLSYLHWGAVVVVDVEVLVLSWLQLDALVRHGSTTTQRGRMKPPSISVTTTTSSPPRSNRFERL